MAHYDDECCTHHHNHESENEYEGKVSKYNEALSQYETNLKDDVVSAKVQHLIEEHLAENDTKEVKRLLFNCMDYTSLKCTDTEEKMVRMTEKVNDFIDKYPDIEPMASLCVYPNMASIINDCLEADHVNIDCTAGGFPSAQTFIEIKIAEIAMAIHEGANEIDVVMPISKFLSEDYEGMCDEIQEMKETCGDKTLKVILESGMLGSCSRIKKAAILSMYAGADFIKTSTGKESVSATPEAALVMCEAIREYHAKTGIKIGFKAAGGLSSVHDALVYYTIVKEVLGKEWLNNKLFRLGTSRLANALLNEITGEEGHFF